MESRPLRRHRRVSLPLAAIVTPLDGTTPAMRTHSVDVSESGVMLACVGLSGAVKVALTVPGSRDRLVLTGTVVRTEPGRTAVTFTALASRELQALRKLGTTQQVAA